MAKNRSLQFKIVSSMVVYFLILGVAGSVLLYNYLLGVVSEKGEHLDRVYLEAVGHRLDRNFEDIFSLAMLCAYDPAVLRVVSRQEREGYEFIRDSLNAQDQINAFLQVAPVGSYIDRLILFDNRGLFVQAAGRQSGAASDLDRIRQLPLYARFIAENLPVAQGFGNAILPTGRQHTFTLLIRVRGSYYNPTEAYLYMETGLDMITGVFREFEVPPGVFAQVRETTSDGETAGAVILQSTSLVINLSTPQEGSVGYVPPDTEFPYRFRQGKQSYRLDRMELENPMMVLYNQEDVTSLTVGDRQILFTVLGAALMSLFVAIGLGLTLSANLTRPIQAIINRIHKIYEENDFSYDPEIEKTGDEIGRIGKTVNEMSGNIGRFLVRTEEHYQERKRAQIALLQTQLNPHFLYNTLDSIQWMAKIQSNPTIADFTRRLINLLRSINTRTANGEETKITLGEELRILEDYTEVMSVRFMGSFELDNRIPEAFLDCRIPKLTLQPLVENAILHGIEPSGRFVVITLSAVEDGNYLNIIVEDTGVGMSPEQMETIKTRNTEPEKNPGGPSLNNIGIPNVDKELRLLYDETCGLFFESRLGEYTRVTVRILKERENA
ncbi:hypothetical protein FACS1894124_2610 [Spirochaetia bacterium]|nr:hypothetical protein FACS1894124_2610 [Spirochaetia bacterium]